jgi:hypothetical protein
MNTVDPTRLCNIYPGAVIDEIQDGDPPISCVLANGLVLFSDQGIKIYRFKPFSGSEYGDIEYAFASNTNNLIVYNSGSININSMNLSFKRLNSENTEVKKLKFWGFGCYSNNWGLHPFAQIYLVLQTKDYNKLASSKRFSFALKTRISKRSYN